VDRRRARGRTDLSDRERARLEAATFDRLVATAGDFNPFEPRGWATLARRFAAAVGGEGSSVLDVGCGTGRSRTVYRAHAGRYVGLDLSFGALRHARRREPATWVRADALALPFAAASFDVVAFSSVLHHFDRPAGALAEARRVLLPGGRVFAFDPNALHPAMALFRLPASPFYRAEGVSPGERPLAPSRLRRLFADAGFAAIGQRCQSDIPYRAEAVGSLGRWVRLFNGLDRVWEATGLGRRFGTFVVTWGTRAT
jgi:SAM-dependent methyltransferase